MIIYLASFKAKETKDPYNIPHRLLSFFEVSTDAFGASKVFKNITNENSKTRTLNRTRNGKTRTRKQGKD